MADMIAAENAALSNILKSQTEGGAATGDTYKPGADIPKILAEDPAKAQLLQESVYTQTGQKDKAIAFSQTMKPAPAVITSSAASTRNAENQNTLNTYQTQLEESNASGTTGNTSTKASTVSPTTGTTDTEVDPLQVKIDSATSAIDTEYANAATLLDSRMGTLNAASQASIANIKRVFEQRKEEVKRLNQVLLQSNTKAGIRAGRQRYAPEINQGILTDVEQQGLARISALDAQELDLINQAQAAADSEQFNLLSKKLDLVSQARREKDQAIADLNKAAMEQERFAIEKAREARELQKFERDNASETIDAMVAAGIDPATISDEYFKKLENEAGYAPGTARGLMQLAIKERAMDDLKDQIEIDYAAQDQAMKLNNFLAQLPVGETVTINGVKYNSINKGEIQTSTETEPNGDVWMVGYNQDTRDVTRTYLGNFGNRPFTDIKSNEGAVVRVFDDGTKRVIFNPTQPNGGVATGGLITKFPEGSVTPFTRESGGLDRASECGAWVNDLTGLGVGNTLESKLAKTDPSITADTAQIGDVFVQRAGTTGHIGIINGISTIDGETYFTVSESNWTKKPGTDGKIGLITHTRQIKADEVLGYARPGFKNPEYNFGTDAPDLDGLTFGDATTGTTTVTAPDGTTTAQTTSVAPSLKTADIVKTTEAKKLVGIASLNRAIGDYRALIEKYGAASDFTPAARSKLDSAKEAINLAIKGAEDLGALQAPDIELVTRMIPDVTIEGLKNSLVPHPFLAKTALSTLDQVTEKYAGTAESLYRLLLAQGEGIENDPYVMELARQLNLSSSGEQTTRVRQRSDGATGNIPLSEFDPAIYEKI